MRRFWSDQRGRLVEDALTLPVLLLVAVGMLNLALYGVAGAVAHNAANYGARMGAVAQRDPVGQARAAALQKLQGIQIGAEFSVQVQASPRRGAPVVVRVHYQVPNYFRGLTAFFGIDTPPVLDGEALGWFRHEGW